MKYLLYIVLSSAITLSGCSKNVSNVKYTDLGKSHEYTEYDKNNKIIYSEEMSHNYNDEKICVNCGHLANGSTSNNPYNCNEDATASEYPIFRIKHDTQDVWLCSDLITP